MQNPLQPSYNLRINNKDVTRDTDFGVTYDERADQVTTLTFTLKRGAFYLQVVKPGQKVVLSGGTTTKARAIFTGVIKKIVSIFPDEGDVKINIIAYDTIWGDATNHRKTFVYPQKGSSRAWADKTSIKVSEVVGNIAHEIGADLNIVLPPGSDASYTLTKPLVQMYTDGKGMTDWAFLRQLAKYYGCFIWTDVQGPTLQLNFVDKSKVANYSAKTTFVYPLRDQNEFVYKTLAPNQYLLRDVRVDEDVQAADANLRVVSKFDDKTGDELTLISREVVKDGKKYIYYYQLDEDKVASLEKNDPKEADRLREMGIFDIPPEEFLKYYKEIEYVEDQVAVFSQVFIGITVTATSDGNTDIHSQQAYDLYGIARYSTNERIGKYYLRSLKFVWDEEGFKNEYEFMR
jgi:hypothetical protein